MTRRPGLGALALAPPYVLFLVFGMARVEAPVTAIGLVFEHPWDFAIAAGVVALGGVVLLFLRPVELAVARVIAGSTRVPSGEEAERLDRLLERASGRAGMQPGRLIVRVGDDPTANAAAGAYHLLFVTTGALGLPDDELEAILAHELGHHRGLHPVLTAVLWWLSLPGVALAAVFGLLRRAIATVGTRLGGLGRVLGLPLLLLLLVWQVTVMWLWWLGEVLAKRAARRAEHEADAAAARWGYAAQLRAALERLAKAEVEPAGRLGRLLADHPPTEERVERLRAYSEIAAGGSRVE